MDDAITFAHQILRTSKQEVTHLKLQKLLFYCYGAARALGGYSGRITFERWPHGPVNPVVYEEYKRFGSGIVDCPDDGELLGGAALDAFKVYDRLSAWQLREESHLEAPWRNGVADRGEIDDESIRHYFLQKFATAPVRAPANLPGAWSLALDGLPRIAADSLHQLAQLLAR